MLVAWKRLLSVFVVGVRIWYNPSIPEAIVLWFICASSNGCVAQLAHESANNCSEVVGVDHADNEIESAHSYGDIRVVDAFQDDILLLADKIGV